MIARFFSIVLLCLVGNAGAKTVVNLPFDGGAFGSFRINLTVGTPGQEVSFYLFEREAQPEADVVVNGEYPEGAFFREESSSFQVVNALDNYLGTPIGVNGTDVFTLGDGVTVKLPFRLYDYPFYQVIDDYYLYFDTTAFGLNRPPDGSFSFFQTLLEIFEEKTVVFSYDHVTDSWPMYSWGIVTLGGKAEDRCADDWIIQPEAPWLLPVEQWAVNIDEVTFGTHTFDTPGHLYFSQIEWDLWMPEQYTEWFMNALGIQDYTYVPCDVQTDIVFSVGGAEVHVTPDEYLNRENQETSRRCSLRIEPSEYKQFILPRSVYQRHCVLRDYSNFQIGFATRLPPN
ncbi:hypothetical protein M3Y99_01036000 [Aphelenchoides fujianensis]|nr:hypothetical protein M3Y99_01036000 [Aphelenchoides fujianensis]